MIALISSPRPKIRLLLFIWVMLLGELAFCGESQPRRWALLIGISDYLDPGISTLRYAAGDAETIAEALLAVPHSGYTRDTVITLAGREGSSPTKADIEGAFRDLRAKLMPDDSLVVFFSSHGLDSGERAFLVVADTRENDVESTGLALGELFRLLRSLPIHNRILLIDACHSGASKRFPDTTMGFALHDALEQGSQNAAILSSSKLGQESFESSEFGRGVFTHYLSQALRGAEGVDRDHDGQISLEEAAIYTERRLLEWGRANRIVQQPWLIRTGSGAPPIITSLVPTVDAFGARAKSVDAIGSVQLRYRVQNLEAPYILRGSIATEGVAGGRGRVSLIVVLENGETLSWKVPVDPQSPLNILPEHELPARPSRVLLEEKFYNLEMTSFVPVRAETVEDR